MSLNPKAGWSTERHASVFGEGGRRCGDGSNCAPSGVWERSVCTRASCRRFNQPWENSPVPLARLLPLVIPLIFLLNPGENVPPLPKWRKVLSAMNGPIDKDFTPSPSSPCSPIPWSEKSPSSQECVCQDIGTRLRAVRPRRSPAGLGLICCDLWIPALEHVLLCILCRDP